MELFFYIFATLALLSALFMLLTERLIYAALGLLSVLVNMAALFVLAGAEFLAVTQLMVYAGGVLIILLFGVLMLRQPGQSKIQVRKTYALLAVLTAGTFFVLIFSALNQVNFSLLAWHQGNELAVGEGMLRRTGQLLMSEYVLIFELGGLLLLVALLAAAWIAGKWAKPKSL
jgi:NADH-quinone oxidoreductase subunit J